MIQLKKDENAPWFFLSLKVDGIGGLRFLQLLGISLGPWQSMSIFILNVPFASKKGIFPFPLFPAKWIGDLFDKSDGDQARTSYL